jgi:hypothetical protein
MTASSTVRTPVRPPWAPNVDQDGQRTGGAGQSASHPLDTGDRVDKDNECGRRRVSLQRRPNPVKPGVVDDLVRDEDPIDFRLQCNLGLPRVSDRDCPGARIELAAEDGRGHRRLSVRGEGKPPRSRQNVAMTSMS